MTLDLAIIIPHYNDVTRLCRCLEALEGQDRDGVDVVVADNASTQDLSEVTAQFGWVRFVTQPDAGAGLARNAGVAATTAPWLAFIDADCVAGPDWVSHAKNLAKGDANVVTGGRVDVFEETPSPRSGAESFETVFAFDQHSYISQKGFSVTANLVTSRATFEQTGPFRHSVSEDVDWCHRATALGARLVYDPDLSVRHPSRQDWPALARKWRRLTQEAWALHRSEGGRRLGWGARAMAMPASIVLHAPQIVRHPALLGQERLRGLAMLIRLRLARMVWMLEQALLGRP